MLKVCHVGLYMCGGGAEIFLSNISKRFKNVKLHQSFILGENFYNKEFAQSMSFPVTMCNPKKLREAIENYDVIMTWGPIPMNDILENKKTKTCVFVAHSDMSRNSFELCKKITSHVIAVSNSIKREICYDSTSQVSVCYPGVDESRIICNLEKSVAKKQFGINPHKNVIGYLGGFFPCKRVDRLISFSKYLNDNYHILIAGDGPLFEQLKTNKEHNITFSGKLSCVKKFYKAIDIFCLPSENEGCPQVMFESMCAKVPFIGTPISAMKEIIRHQKNGLLFDGSKDSFLECISFLENKKKYLQIQNAGYNTFSEIGDLDKNRSSEQYESILINAYIKNIYKNKIM